MTNINKDMPAFPVSTITGWTEYGMTLRDWFAGQALAGMFRHDGWLNTRDGDEKEAAYRAYRIADSMLAARIEGNEKCAQSLSQHWRICSEF